MGEWGLVCVLRCALGRSGETEQTRGHVTSPPARPADPTSPRFEDTSLFEENLLAVQEAGAAFVTVHPRTKKQTYDGWADWSLIARAAQLLTIPVVSRVWGGVTGQS